MQTASSSGISNIAELANRPNYSHLSPPVNIAIVSLSLFYRCGCRVKCQAKDAATMGWRFNCHPIMSTTPTSAGEHLKVLATLRVE
jgi:hypothetical protein